MNMQTCNAANIHSPVTLKKYPYVDCDISQWKLPQQ